MRKNSPVLVWLLLLLACFHAAAMASHHAHGSGPSGAIAFVAHTAAGETPEDSAPSAAHTGCTACVLQAHTALPAALLPAWTPAVLPAAPRQWARAEGVAHRTASRSRFAARDPPEAG